MDNELQAQAKKVAALDIERSRRRDALEQARTAHDETNEAYEIAMNEYRAMCSQVVKAATAELQFEQAVV